MIINEYVDVAKAFFDEDEPGMVNGVLDRVARKLRAEEVGARGPATSAATDSDENGPERNDD